MKSILAFGILLLASGGCNAADNAPAKPDGALPFNVEVVADFDKPWAMTFLPDSQSALVTEKKGKLLLWQAGGQTVEVAGVPKVDYGGQGGLGDVVLSPDFAKNNEIYISWVEGGPNNTHGAVVGKARFLKTSSGNPLLGQMTVIWRQSPKVDGRGHFGHRIAFGPDGMLYISSGERQKFDPAQDTLQNLGKIIRLNPDGTIPPNNPFTDSLVQYQGHDDKPPVPLIDNTRQIWSMGHRNPLGLAFDSDGRLWNIEMGPQGGDELNLVKRGANYGYPKVSNGNHYDGRDIPDHSPGDGFEAPKVYWNPSISPGSLMIYSGGMFPQWKGDAFVGALGAEALVRVHLDGDKATKGDEWPMGARIREVEQGPDGAIWVLEDGDNGSQGRMLKLTPKK